MRTTGKGNEVQLHNNLTAALGKKTSISSISQKNRKFTVKKLPLYRFQSLAKSQIKDTNIL